jgi:hypothetical protein
LQYLQKEGLIAPNEVSPESDAVPLDFTSLNNREIGSVHSRYAVRHAHAIFVAAKLSGTLAMIKRELRLEQAKFRIRNGKKYKTKYELDDAMQLDEGVFDIYQLQAEKEAELEVVNAVALGYEDLRNAASREMFRRSSEVAPKD